MEAKQQVPWAVGQRRRGIGASSSIVIIPRRLVEEKFGLWSCEVEGKAGTYAYGDTWPSELLPDTPIDGAEGVKGCTLCGGSERHNSSCPCLQEEDELAPNPATPASRPEPAVGQTWRYKADNKYGRGGELIGIDRPCGYAPNSFWLMPQQAWASAEYLKEIAEYVSGPVVDQTRPTCLECGGYSLPVPEGWTPPIDQCWRRGAVIWQCNAGVDQTRPKAPNPSACRRCSDPDAKHFHAGDRYCVRCWDYLNGAPSPGVGAGTFSNVLSKQTITADSIKQTVADMAKIMRAPVKFWGPADIGMQRGSNDGLPFAGPAQQQFYGAGLANRLLEAQSGPSPGVAGQGPEPACEFCGGRPVLITGCCKECDYEIGKQAGLTPPVHQVPCGLTTRSGIPCDLLPHQHKGRACAVLPKTQVEQGLMKREVTGLSEADIEREAAGPWRKR